MKLLICVMPFGVELSVVPIFVFIIRIVRIVQLSLEKLLFVLLRGVSGNYQLEPHLGQKILLTSLMVLMSISA